MRDQLKHALTERMPDMKDYVADRCVDNYTAAVMAEIAAQFAMMTKDDFAAGEMSFGAEAVLRACKQVRLDGKRVHIWTLMQAERTTSLVLPMYRGNNLSGRVSRVIFNPAFKKDIMNELQSLTFDINPQRLTTLEAQANWDLKVDPASLASYITHTRRTLGNSGNSDAYQDKLTRNLIIATTLKDQVRTLADGTTYVSEYWEEIDSGRMYGHGLSLQRIPREVRHAALGECHKYDFKASSYALMTSLAVKIDPGLKVGAITDYIKHRSAIRKRIAQHVGISEDWAKSVFTSLGFGAQLKDNAHNAIRSKLGQEKYNKLVGNDEFSMIAKQLAAVSKVIHAQFPNEGFEFYGREYRPLDPKTGAKRTKNQKLAWIYQCLESEALRRFIDMAEADPLLTAHDCLYFKQKLSAAKTADIAFRLSQQFDLLRFEHEQIVPIHASEDHGKRDREISTKEAAHARFIGEQERVAAAYRSLYIDGIQPAKKHTLSPWGPIEAPIWQQFAPAQQDSGYSCIGRR